MKQTGEDLSKPYDVAIIGAGFAGLIASRELHSRGFRTIVLEARDRIAGRTWLDRRMGLDLELGGTWVHWTQPYVWGELTRYGIGVAPSPEPENAYWWNGSERKEGSPSELLELLDQPNQKLTSESRTYFPQPFSPFAGPDLFEIDRVTLEQRIAQLDLSIEERELLTSFWTLNFNGHIKDAALTQALRWVALTNGDWAVNFEACATYKVAGGTKALATAIADDAGADLLLSADVRSVEHSDTGALIHLADGRTVRASKAIITIPLHALERVAFDPPLSPRRSEAVRKGQLGKGLKVWIKLKGARSPFVALGSSDWPITFFQSEYVHGGHTYVIGFGPDSHALDTSDVKAVQEILQRLVPDAIVGETAAHDWVADEFAGETWPMHRTGYLTDSLRALQEPEDSLYFASSDIANGWGGFIDGAIESGLAAASTIIRSTPLPEPATSEQNPLQSSTPELLRR